jgi:hypothetical protein
MYRAFAQVWLVGLVPDDQRDAQLDRALEAADTDSQRPGEIRAWLFKSAARWLPERALRELRAGAQQEGRRAHDYWEAMTAALPDLPDLYEDVLANTRKRWSAFETSKAVRAVLAASPPETRAALVAERLAAYDSDEHRYFPGLLVEDLAADLPSEELRTLLDRELEGASPTIAVIMLAAAIPRLAAEDQPALLAKALEFVSTDDVNLSRERTAALLPLLSEPDRTKLLEEKFDAAFRRHPASAVWTACETAQFLPEHLLRRVIDHADAANPPEDALNRLAPYLTPSLLRHFLASRLVDDPQWWARTLVRLAPGQSPETLERILGIIPGVDDGEQRISLLTKLAGLLPATLVATAVEAFPDDSAAEPKAQLLAALAARAAGPERDALEREARDLATSPEYPHAGFGSLPELAKDLGQLQAVLHLQCVLDRGTYHRPPPRDPVPLPDALIDRAAHLARTRYGPCQLASALAILVPYSAPERRAALLREATLTVLTPHVHDDDIPCDGLRTLKRAAPAVPGGARPPLSPGDLTPLLVQDDSFERMRQFLCLLAYLPESQRGDIPKRALDCLTTMTAASDADWQSRHCHEDLAALAPYLAPDAWRRAVQLAHALKGPYQTADILADLAAQADPATRPELLREAVSYLRTVAREYELLGPLATLARYLDEDDAAAFLDRLLRLVNDDRGPGSFPRTISLIAPQLTPALLDQAAAAVRDHPIATERAEASKAIAQAAATMYPDPWPTYGRTALADAAATGRPTLLSLIADLPLPDQDGAARLIQALLDVRRWWPTKTGNPGRRT